MPKLLQVILYSLLLTSQSYAGSAIYSASVEGDFDKVYKNIYQSLEHNRLFVVFEPDIGANLSGFANRWGKEYNRNKLERFKAMVFCNGWYANQISNLDVSMTAMCPLHISISLRNRIVSVHFVRPDVIAKDSKAAGVARELTELVIKAINEGLRPKTAQ